jgi:hypothetical protein
MAKPITTHPAPPPKPWVITLALLELCNWSIPVVIAMMEHGGVITAASLGLPVR